MNPKSLPLALIAAVLCGCVAKQDMATVADDAAVRSKVKPELDFSGETPDCKTAGARIAEHIEVGMTLDDVERLVGRPRLKLPGSWWWSMSLSEQGRPVVKFPFGSGLPDVVITAAESDVSECDVS